MRLSLLATADWIFLIALPLVLFGTSIGYALSPGSKLESLFLLWIVSGIWMGISFILIASRSNLGQVKRYYSQHMIWVGWTRSKYAVDIDEFDAQIAFLISRMSKTYPDAWKALAGCTVVFREPEWTQLETLRQVRGEQDGALVVVGWAPDLRDTALLHELGHRVLEVCASIPDEEAGHQELAKFGLE